MTYLPISSLIDIKHKPVIGDLIYGSDSYYAQITRVGESVVEFDVIAPIANLDDLNERIDTIITTPAEGVSAQEIIDARQGELSLGANITKVKSQLSQLVQKGYYDFGEIKLPNDFPKLPFELFRDFDGVVKHNFKYEPNGIEVFCDTVSGSDLEGDGSNNNPFRTIKKSIEHAAASIDNEFIIKVKDWFLDRDKLFGTTPINISNKKIHIVPDNNEDMLFITNHTDGLEWEIDESIWKTTRSLVFDVFNLKRTDVYGNPIPFTFTNSLQECRNLINSWYTDGSNVWVNTSNGNEPNSDYVIATRHIIFGVNLLNGSELHLKNIRFIASGDIQVINFTGDGTSDLYLHDSRSIGGNSRGTNSTHNNWNILNLKRIFSFNSQAAYSARDGFNYHFNGVDISKRRECLVFEYNCIAYNNGLLDSNANNNATTAHGGVSVLRVNSIGYNTRGPVLADVNGCRSIAIDCHMRDSVLSEYSPNATSFYYDNLNASEDGESILINCSGQSPMYAIGGQSGFKVTVQNYKGYPIKEDLLLDEL